MGKIRNDIILIISIAILIIGSFVWWIIANIDSPDRLYVNIYHDEELLYSVPLDEDKEIEVKGSIGILHIVIEDGYVFVEEADCPNHICVKEGKINKNNETITCIPNLVYIKIGGIAYE